MGSSGCNTFIMRKGSDFNGFWIERFSDPLRFSSFSWIGVVTADIHALLITMSLFGVTLLCS